MRTASSDSRGDVALRNITLTPVSYTEPSGKAHFAQTLDSEVVLHITGFGPSGMRYTRRDEGIGADIQRIDHPKPQSLTTQVQKG